MVGRREQGTVVMVDDPTEINAPPSDAGRARRAPPTIDLEATEVSGASSDSAPPEQPGPAPAAAPTARSGSAFIAALSGAAASALVIGAVWLAGWPANPPASAPQPNTTAIDQLTSRVADLETKMARPPATAPDPAAAARIDALEKSVSSLRGELASARAQSDKLAAAVNDVKSAPREATAPPDLSAINDRLAQLERATTAQGTQIAQEGAKIADNKPADDVPLRRVVVASMLDIAVRQGDPYGAALAAAKSLATNSDALKPLDGFATSGVPSAANLSRELLTLVPKLSPAAPESATTGAGIVDRLQAGAAKLVRIERTDATGDSRGSVVARATAAALRNDSAEARRELNTLAPADRAAAQAWIDKADARDAALAASRQFAADAMAALVKPAP
jgi:hypothetical protein